MKRLGTLITTTAAAATLALAGCGAGTSEPPAPPATRSTPGAPTTDQPTPDGTSAPTTVTIGATGDVLAHAPVNAGAAARTGGVGYDYGPSFEAIAPRVRAADVSLCHMETPLSPDNSNLTVPGTKVFNTPREMATALRRAGYDGCDFASDHTWDHGLDGLRGTQHVMRSAGLRYAGPSPTRSGRGAVGWHEANGLRVAHLAYSYAIINQGEPTTQAPPDAPWLHSSLWLARGARGIRADARAARAQGADVVVASLHWGAEYVTAPTGQQRELARALLRSGDVDLILGTHVHVIQPCERIAGRYVFYGLGNSLSNQSPTTSPDLRPETQEGLFVRVALTKQPDGTVTSRAAYLPTRVDLDGHVIEPATPQTQPETFRRTTATLGSLGAGTCPISPA